MTPPLVDVVEDFAGVFDGPLRRRQEELPESRQVDAAAVKVGRLQTSHRGTGWSVQVLRKLWMDG